MLTAALQCEVKDKMRRVVITGMGVISPVGNDLKSFENAIFSGESGIGPISRFDTTDYKVKVAAEVKGFDPLLYIEKGEVRKIDLFAQYALAAAAQAIEQSKINGNIDPKRLGVYVGSGIGGMATFYDESEKHIKSGPRRISPHFVPMIISNMASGRIAIKYNARGPVLPMVTACATSTHEIGEAFHAISQGYADAIIAGGCEATIIPLAIAGFTNCMALSQTTDPDNASIPFDKRRNGFVMGEGAGILVLEEYGHAVGRDAVILGEICGYGNTCDAFHVTAPRDDGEGAAEAMRLAMAEAGIEDAGELYINAHGTSTYLNDKIETLAIKTVLGKAAKKCSGQFHKVDDRAYAGRCGCCGGDCLYPVAHTRTSASHYRLPRNRRGMRSRLCAEHGGAMPRSKFALSNSLGFGGHNALCCIQNGTKGRFRFYDDHRDGSAGKN